MNSPSTCVFDFGIKTGPLEDIVVRISLVLTFAWLVHAWLTRANSRWRVLICRVAAVAVLLAPTVTLWAPSISLEILPAQTPIQSAALAVWVLGAALGLVCDACAWLQSRALRRRSELVNSETALLGSSIAAGLGCRRKFEICRTRDLNSPCVLGVL